MPWKSGPLASPPAHTLQSMSSDLPWLWPLWAFLRLQQILVPCRLVLLGISEEPGGLPGAGTVSCPC